MEYYTYTQEQHDKIVELLLKIQIFLPSNTSPEECKVIDEAVKDIYKIIYSEQSEIKWRIYNPVTGHYYNIVKKSSKYKESGSIKGIWKKK
jgi:hypothetical protein